MKECNISNITELNEKLQVVENVLTKYIFQLRLVFFGSIFVQCMHSVYQVSISFTEGNCVQPLLFLVVNMAAAPLTIFIEMVKTTTALRDPSMEDSQQINEYTFMVSKYRSRYEFKVLEAFRESLGSCRIQMSFYFAFSYIVGKELESVNCMTKHVLGKGSKKNRYF